MLSCWFVSDVGAVPELSAAAGSLWVGVDLDEPVGKHAGSVLGKCYFTAQGSKHGTFVKPSNVTCGDFPELDPFDDDDDQREAHDEQHTSNTTDSSGGSALSQLPSSSEQTQQDKSNLYEEL